MGDLHVQRGLAVATAGIPIRQQNRQVRGQILQCVVVVVILNAVVAMAVID